VVRIFLALRLPSTSPQAPSTLLLLQHHPRSHPLLDNMPRAANPSRTSNNIWNRFYTEWCKGRKECGLPCSRKLASEEWKKMSQDEKAKYSLRSGKTPEQAEVPGLSDEVLANTGLNATPIQHEEQLPASPVFSEVGSVTNPSTFGEPPITVLSVLDQPPSAGLSSVVHELALPGLPATSEFPDLGPFFTANQSSFAADFSPVEEAFVPGPPPTPLSAPIPSHPLTGDHFLNDASFSYLDEFTYEYSDLTPDPAFISPEFNLWEIFGEVPSSSTVSTEISESSGPPTPVPVTPATGYHPLEFLTTGCTPQLHALDIPAELDNYQFGFNGVEAEVPGQQMWNGQQGLAPPAPATAPGQFDQTAGFPGFPHLWNDQPQAGPSRAFDQDVTHAAVQQAFNAVNVNNFGLDGKPLRVGLVGVQLWFAPA